MHKCNVEGEFKKKAFKSVVMKGIHCIARAFFPIIKRTSVTESLMVVRINTFMKEIRSLWAFKTQSSTQIHNCGQGLRTMPKGV